MIVPHHADCGGVDVHVLSRQHHAATKLDTNEHGGASVHLQLEQIKLRLRVHTKRSSGYL